MRAKLWFVSRVGKYAIAKNIAVINIVRPTKGGNDAGKLSAIALLDFNEGASVKRRIATVPIYPAIHDWAPSFLSARSAA